MKKIYTLITMLLIPLLSSSQVKYQNFDEGWRIGLSENIQWDVNQDGEVDLLINAYGEELGFSPVFIKGCLASPSEFATVGFGARELSIFQEGDIISGQDIGFFNFIDDDRGSMWHTTEGFASGWETGEDYYIGFILLGSGNGAIQANNGWIKVMIDEEAQELVIKEVAYNATLDVPIEVGAVTTSASELQNDISNLTLAPNPASDLIQVTMDYQGTSTLNISILNSNGKFVKEVNSLFQNGKQAISIDVSDLNNGSYYIRFQNEKGLKTERITVIH